MIFVLAKMVFAFIIFIGYISIVAYTCTRCIIDVPMDTKENIIPFIKHLICYFIVIFIEIIVLILIIKRI